MNLIYSTPFNTPLSYLISNSLVLCLYQERYKGTTSFDIVKYFANYFLKKVKIFFDSKPTKR
jgi:hypothetical protein